MNKFSKWTMFVSALTLVLIILLLVCLKSVKSELHAIKASLARQEFQEQLTSSVAPQAEVVEASVVGDSQKGKAIFMRSCTACHSVGKGDLVGPDLKDVVQRRDVAWLKSFILNPTKVIESKDPIALELLAKYKVPMMSMGLNDVEVDAVIEYLKNPAGSSVTETQAEKVEPTKVIDQEKLRSEILKGEALFQGKHRLVNGGPSCLACHHVNGGSFLGGGTLAKDLTEAYSRLGSEAISAILGNPPFPVMKKAYVDNSLEKEEISAILAYLAKTSATEKNSPHEKNSSKIILFSLGGLLQLLLLYGFIWAYRRKKTINKALYDRQKNSEKES